MILYETVMETMNAISDIIKNEEPDTANLFLFVSKQR